MAPQSLDHSIESVLQGPAHTYNNKADDILGTPVMSAVQTFLCSLLRVNNHRYVCKIFCRPKEMPA
jgi:hypothetical protein